MIKQAAILTLTTLTLAACNSVPQREVQTRDTPAPIERREVGVQPTPAGAGQPAALPPGGYLEGDGPAADVPPNLSEIPDAVPKSEPLHRYANRPYVALGKTYTPLQVAGNYKARGIASWYGKKFHGQRTSSGEVYDMYAMTGAHPTLPIPSFARITNAANGKSVIVRINDRGPFLHDRVVDLSYTAAHKLGILGNGSAEVEVESLASNAVVGTVSRVEPLQVRPLEKAVPVETSAPVQIASVAVGSNVFLQLGAFKSKEAAASFMEKMNSELGDVGKKLTMYNKDGLSRVHVGPYANEAEARSNAVELETRLGFKPMLNLH